MVTLAWLAKSPTVMVTGTELPGLIDSGLAMTFPAYLNVPRPGGGAINHFDPATLAVARAGYSGAHMCK